MLTWYDIKEFSYLISQKLTPNKLENIEKIHRAKIEIKEDKSTLKEHFFKTDTLSKMQRDEKVKASYPMLLLIF